MAEGNQKIENLLNLALEATQEERQKSEVLDAGYGEEDRMWEVIVRSSGTLAGRVPQDWEVVQLSGGYEVVILPREAIRTLALMPQVEYVEMSKQMYFALDIGRTASCVSVVQTPQLDLTGRGVLVAVIDSGVDYFHPDFRNEDGSTRIVAMWDQTGVLRENGAESESRAGRILEDFSMGLEYTREEINAALSAGSRGAGYAIVPERDVSGHGTEVLGIAAGNGRASAGRYRGIAPESELIVVKLGMFRENGSPRTAELMQALEYVIRKAEELVRPVAVNISIGSVYGSHRGTSLLETYINGVANRGRNVISVGTGNEGNTGGHTSGRLVAGRPQMIEFLIDDYETSINIQLWKDYADEFEVTVIHPDGQRVVLPRRGTGVSRYRVGNEELLIYYGEPSPYQGRQEIFLDFIPDGSYLDSGVWAVLLSPVRLVTGEYQMWMIDGKARGSGTRFLQPSADTTMTIPSTAARVIAVGAYDARNRSYASFSGRGWPEETFTPKPDLAAPGVDVTTTAVGGGYISVSGTSFATPFVTGAAALLMQWGIVNGNDPYLYGEKVRAYLRSGARQLPGFARYPNNWVGYGALCVGESLPG